MPYSSFLSALLISFIILWIIEDYLNQNIYLDALYVGFFFFIFVFIILGLVAIYRWCRYDQHRLEQVRKTRIQSPTLISPSDISVSYTHLRAHATEAAIV